jgi:hypothetical protein
VSDYPINIFIFWSDEDGGYIARAKGKPIPVASYRPRVP